MDCNKIIERYNKLKSVHDGYWLSLWRDVRTYVYPNYSDYKTEGSIRTAEIFDATAIEARVRLAAGIYNWGAPPDKRWFELIAADDELAKDEEVKNYFSEVTKTIREAIANSNWPTVFVKALNELACGLDGIVFVEDGGVEMPLAFSMFPVEQVVYANNSKGKVDTVFRECKMSARQIVQEFGEKNLPEKILSAARRTDGGQDMEFRILHAVYPRMSREPGVADNKNMPFADVYIELDSRTCIYESGYEENPYMVCRFEQAANEAYGRGPGINKLPDIKMLNRMRQAYILGSEHSADPSWLMPDGSIVSKNFDKSPGSIIEYKPSVNGAKPERLIFAGDMPKLAADIEAERQGVRLGFYNDIFDPLGDLTNITATEAEIRNEGKIVPFAPIFGNLSSELFSPLIHRVYGILLRRGRLPELPEILYDKPDYKVEYVSKIALSIKKLESLGWLQTEASLQAMAQANPDVLDNFVLDDIARDIALNNGSAPKWLRSIKERDAIRSGRAEQLAAEQQAAMLAQGAAAAPDLAKAPEPGSPLEAVMNNNGI